MATYEMFDDEVKNRCLQLSSYVFWILNPAMQLVGQGVSVLGKLGYGRVDGKVLSGQCVRIDPGIRHMYLGQGEYMR